MNGPRSILAALALSVLSLGAVVAHAQVVPVSEYWRISEGGTGYDTPADIVIDFFGNSYVTGTRTTGSGESEFFTTRYSALRNNMTLEPSSRNEAAWSGGTSGLHQARALALGNFGELLVVGESPNENGDLDIVVLRYTATGLTLDNAWSDAGEGAGVRRYDGGLGDDRALDVMTDGSGNVYVIGVSYQGPTRGDDYIMLKYSLAGDLSSTWSDVGAGVGVRLYNGPGNGADTPVAGAIEFGGGSPTLEQVNSLYVTGTSYGGTTTKNDIATLRFDRDNGDLLWTHRYNGPGSINDGAADIAIVLPNTLTSRIYVTGYCRKSFGGGGVGAFGGGQTYLDGRLDYITIRLDEDSSSHVWAVQYDGPANAGDLATAVAVIEDDEPDPELANDEVYVVGTSTGGATARDIKVVRYNGSDGTQFWTTDSAGRYDGVGDEDEGYDIAAGAGAVYFTGFTINSNGDADYITRSLYPNDGSTRWTAFHNGVANGGDGGLKLAIDYKSQSAPNGVFKVVVTGLQFVMGRSADTHTIRYAECCLNPSTGACQTCP